MTKVKTKHVVLSASLALLTALSACAKPGDGGFRAKKEDTAPTTGPDASPAKAAAEMKAEEEAKKKAEAEKAAAVAAGTTPAPTKDEEAAAAAEKEKQEKAKADDKATSAQLFLNERNGQGAVAAAGETPAATQSPAPAAGTVATADAPKADAPKTDSPKTDETPVAAATDGTTPATETAPAALSVEDAAKLAQLKKQYFVSLINPGMLANYTILRQRARLSELRLKPDMWSITDQRDFDKLKKKYVGEDFVTTDQLLMRIHAVHLAVAIPLMVAQNGWDMSDLKKNRELFDKTVSDLNSSNLQENIRFRAARAKYDTKSVKHASVELIKAYLGISYDVTKLDGDQKKIVDLAQEMYVLGQDAEIQNYFQIAVRRLETQGEAAKKTNLPYDLPATLD